MKKIVSIIIIMLLIIGLSSNNVNAASCNVSVSSDNTTPKVGDLVVVTVSFSVPVTTASFVLNYDNTILEYVTDNIGANNTGNSVEINYIVFNLQTIDSVKITFKVKSEGTAECGLSEAVLSNIDGKLTTNISKGSVKINATKSNNSTTNGSTSNNENNNTNNSSTSSNVGNSSSSNTTNTQPSFKKVNQTVYAKINVNIRESWTSNSDRLGTLLEGEDITRTGIGSNGWDRVDYNGKTAYIYSTYLTTTKPNKEETTNNENTNKIENTVANENIENTNEIENSNEVPEDETLKNTEENKTTNEIIENEISNEIENSTNVNKQTNSSIYIFYVVVGVVGIGILIVVIVSIRENKRNRRNRRK